MKITFDAMAVGLTLRTRLEAEALELTSIDNSPLIRQSEVSQAPVIDADQVDYLFHCQFAMVQIMLKKN